MKISNLKLISFRNYDQIDVIFQEGLNIIYGKNAQGKTNLVEAIAYLSTLKSFRMHEDNDLIKHNTLFFALEAQLNYKGRNTCLKCNYSPKVKKMYLNDMEVSKVREFIGILNAVVFYYGDIGLFKDSPKRRRYFMDSELSKISPSYLFSLLKYQKLLKERNETLKREQIDEIYLKVLTSQIAIEVKNIARRRLNFLNDLEQKIKVKYQEYSNDDRVISFNYKSDFKDANDVIKIEELFMNSLKKDISYKVTQLGIHKDDFEVLVDNKPFDVYASQGQQRLMAIALKLSLLEIVKEQIKESPIIIFDDVMSELDETRREKLLSLLNQKMQVFITTANVSEIKDFIGNVEANYYLVDNGTIKLVEGS